MPSRPPRPCGSPGCGALTFGRYCTTHQKAAYARDRATRGSAAQRGYDSKWAEYSRQYRIQHPLCIRCREAGRLVPTDHVDHKRPVTGPKDPLFWSPRNHQPLCQSCHSHKTVTEDARGLSNPPRPR